MTSIEYAAIAVVVALAILAGASMIGPRLSGEFCKIEVALVGHPMVVACHR